MSKNFLHGGKVGVRSWIGYVASTATDGKGNEQRRRGRRWRILCETSLRGTARAMLGALQGLPGTESSTDSDIFCFTARDDHAAATQQFPSENACSLLPRFTMLNDEAHKHIATCTS